MTTVKAYQEDMTIPDHLKTENGKTTARIKKWLTSKIPYVLIGVMYSRANDKAETAYQARGGLSLRALNLSLDLLPGSGIALLLLVDGAGSG